MTRGLGNNPIVVVSAVVVSHDAFVATVTSAEPIEAPGYPATLWGLGQSGRALAELHRIIEVSGDRLVLTYRTRPAVAIHYAEVPDVGEEGELIQWWTPELVNMIRDPNRRMDRIPSSEQWADFCQMCWKNMPDGPWAWGKDGCDLICTDCHEKFVEQDRLGLR